MWYDRVTKFIALCNGKVLKIDLALFLWYKNSQRNRVLVLFMLMIFVDRKCQLHFNTPIKRNILYWKNRK